MGPPGESSLIGLTRKEIAEQLLLLGVRQQSCKMRVSQLWHWIYFRGAKSFGQITTISKDLRASLAEKYSLERFVVSEKQVSKDGTRKWLVKFGLNNEVETVFIPEKARGALCISSQIGCTLNCRFCHTGTMPLVRNLTAAEIVSQLLVARDELDEWPPNNRNRLISNIVMMGMGEPLYNYDEVAKAIKIFLDPEGFNISRRRVTLSTAGVVPMINRVGKELGVGLAISLHAVTDDLRNELVPLNRKYPIKELISALRAYPYTRNSRRITFEYVMLKGINDSIVDAKALCNLISGIPAKINLIPFNPWPNVPYECSNRKDIEAFAEVVNKAGYSSPVRTPRGRDIMAACGQLKTESQRLRVKY